jgi:serine/threonine-protein kinase HipA
MTVQARDTLEFRRKPPLSVVWGAKLDLRDLVENERLCAQMRAAYGLPVAACEPLGFEDLKVLAVERFDRTWLRAPQGDRRHLLLPQ